VKKPSIRLLIRSVGCLLCCAQVSITACSRSGKNKQEQTVASLKEAGEYVFYQLYGLKCDDSAAMSELTAYDMPLLPGTRPPSHRYLRYLYFTNSTTYLRYLIGVGIIEKGSPFFAATCDSRSNVKPSEDFTREHNPWCMAAGRQYSEEMPILFTRNLHISNLAESLEDARLEGPPLGTNGIVVVYRDSRVAFIPRADIPRLFNPSGATNVVLRP
jgi:hypothetical protein